MGLLLCYNFLVMKIRIFSIIAIILLVTSFFAHSVFGQNVVEKREQELRDELAQVEKEIAEQQTILQEKQRESVSLERDISILTAKIQEAKLTIKAKNILISQLGKDISVKNATIAELDDRIDQGKITLAQLIRRTNQYDSFTMAEVFLSSSNLSDFFENVDSYDTLQRGLQKVFADIRGNISQADQERTSLTKRQNSELDARKTIESEQRSIEKNETQKQKLLSLNKQQESEYQKVLSAREKRAAEIRTALFALRDSAAIPFGTALQYAEDAEKLTGIRPAFLLAILTQESNLGENVGTCNRPQDPIEKHWKAIMPGPEDSDKSYRDDESAYLRITKALGLDPDSMPLSCPWLNGWGGAMGPSQFIPTTWEAYANRVGKLVGKTMPNPWETKDAFVASSVYLTDLGADARTYTAERTAALKYYAGGNWNKPQNAFYGNQVMVKAQNIQENMIDPLKDL